MPHQLAFHTAEPTFYPVGSITPIIPRKSNGDPLPPWCACYGTTTGRPPVRRPDLLLAFLESRELAITLELLSNPDGIDL